MLTLPDEYKGFSIALTGCRASNIAYDCCEYDLIILEDCKNAVFSIDDKYFEVHRLSNDKVTMTLQLYNSIIMQDPSLRLSALKHSIEPNILKIHAKDMLINALLDASNALDSNVLEASFLIKRSAYLYLNALLEMNLMIPSPLHMLSQLRSLDLDLTLALNCLGVERSNKASVTRAIGMLSRLSDSRLIHRKLLYLYENLKYADCNLYLTYLGITIAKNNFAKMLDMLNILMDLSRDEQSIKRLSNDMFITCKKMLKNY